MSEASDPDADGPDGQDGGEDTTDVDRVLDAIAPLCDRMDTFAGFSVGWAKEWEGGHGRVVDWTTVEVTFRICQPRHPAEADHALGMLRDAGYEVDRVKRGGSMYTEIILRVHVGEDEPEERGPSGDGEQSTLG
jgi:hypothetical protein